jgi:hypothetical protein
MCGERALYKPFGELNRTPNRRVRARTHQHRPNTPEKAGMPAPTADRLQGIPPLPPAGFGPRQIQPRPPGPARPDFPGVRRADGPLPTRLARSGNGPADLPPEGPLTGPGR